jgi:hypothetical protein
VKFCTSHEIAGKHAFVGPLTFDEIGAGRRPLCGEVIAGAKRRATARLPTTQLTSSGRNSGEAGLRRLSVDAPAASIRALKVSCLPWLAECRALRTISMLWT